MKSAKSNSQSGFTLVELMIATTIFTFILLIATAGIIQLGRLYYKGITQAQIQEAIRSISGDINQAVQFSEGSYSSRPPYTNDDGILVKEFCIGDTKYKVFIDQEYKNEPETATTSGIWGTTYNQSFKDNNDCIAPVGQIVEERQLLGNNMRALNFDVQPVENSNYKAWNVNIRLAYGDDDLLTHYLDSGERDTSVEAAQASCKSGIPGSSFCAVAELDTIIKKRIQ